MWTEIGGLSIFTVLLGVILRTQSISISKKTDKAMCKQRYGEVKEDLIKGDEKFGKIDKLMQDYQKEQIEQGKVLVEVFTIVDRMEKNGR